MERSRRRGRCLRTHKPNTNRTQTEHKHNTNRTQTGHKPERTGHEQTNNKQQTQHTHTQTTRIDTNKQTQHKPNTNTNTKTNPTQTEQTNTTHRKSEKEVSEGLGRGFKRMKGSVKKDLESRSQKDREGAGDTFAHTQRNKQKQTEQTQHKPNKRTDLLSLSIKRKDLALFVSPSLLRVVSTSLVSVNRPWRGARRSG